MSLLYFLSFLLSFSSCFVLQVHISVFVQAVVSLTCSLKLDIKIVSSWFCLFCFVLFCSYKQYCNANIYNFAVSVDPRYTNDLIPAFEGRFVSVSGPVWTIPRDSLLCSWADLLGSHPSSLSLLWCFYVRYKLARLVLLFLHFSREELTLMRVIMQVTLCISNWYFKNLYWLCIKQREINWLINKIIYFFLYIINNGFIIIAIIIFYTIWICVFPQFFHYWYHYPEILTKRAGNL